MARKWVFWLTFVGDGHGQTVGVKIGDLGRMAVAPRADVSPSQTGEASHSVPVSLPPAYPLGER